MSGVDDLLKALKHELHWNLSVNLFKKKLNFKFWIYSISLKFFVYSDFAFMATTSVTSGISLIVTVLL